GCAGGRGGRGRFAFGKRRANGGRELHRIAVPADMHVVRRWIAPQDVIVDRGDFEPPPHHLAYYRGDLGVEQHEIAHHHYPAVRRLERSPAAERERGPDRHAV